MLMFTSLEPAIDFSPGPPPVVEDTVIDFIDGVYTVGSTSYAVGDAVTHTDLIDAGGMEAPEFSGYAISMKSPFDGVPLSDSFTAVVEWKNLKVLDDSSPQYILLCFQNYDLYAVPGDGAAIYLSVNASGTAQTRLEVWNDSADTEEFIFAAFTAVPFALDSIYKVAFNYSAGEIALSLNGQTVQTSSSVSPIGRIYALIGSLTETPDNGGSTTLGEVAIRRIWLYATQKPNSDLPTLSAP